MFIENLPRAACLYRFMDAAGGKAPILSGACSPLVLGKGTCIPPVFRCVQ